MNKGIIFEGGAMRGLFTAGVIDVLMEEDITVDAMIGVSAGVAFGCNYKSRQNGRVLRYNTTFCKDSRYCGVRTFLKTGDIFGADFCYNEMPYKLDIFDIETYENNPMDLHLVCTDINTGKAVYQKCNKVDQECMDWYRASASMPVVSRTVEVGGYQLLDGGIADSIPLKYFESIGYKKNIVVLTQPRGYQKKKNGLIPLMKIRYKNYPKLNEAMSHRHEVYNETLEYLWEKEAAGEVYVICPKEKLPIGHISHKADVITNVYNIGREIAKEHVEGLRKFLED